MSSALPLPSDPTHPALHAPLARTVQMMGLATLLMLAFSVAPSLLPLLGHGSTPMRVGLGLVLVHLLMVAGGLASLPRVLDGNPRSRRRMILAAALSAVVFAVGIGLASPVRDEITPPNLWGPGYWVLPWLEWVLPLLRRWQRSATTVLTMVVLVLLHCMGLPRLGHQPWRLVLEQLVWLVEPVALTAVFVSGVAVAGERRDRSVQEGLAAQRQQDRERAAARDRHEAERLLQDHLLHALLALANDVDVVPADMVREECRETVQAIDKAADPTRLVDLHALLAADPAIGAAGARIVGTARLAPAMAARALSEAAHEALSNVARHALADHCTLTLSSARDHWSIVIEDDGIGFDARRPIVSGSGLDVGIVGRLDDIGGSAVVDSSPGTGTRVELRWPSAETPPTRPSTDTVDREVRRSMPHAAWPALLAGVGMTVVAADSMTTPALAVANAAAVLAIGAFYAVRLRTQPLRRRDAVVLVTSALVAWVVHVSLLPTPPGIPQLWMAWQASGLLMLVVLQVPWWTGVSITVAWLVVQAAGLLLTGGWRGGWPLIGPTIAAGVGELVIGMICLRLIRHLDASQQAGLRELEQTKRVTANVHRGIELDQHWSHTVTQTVLPTLRAVADGSRDPKDPQLVRAARTWAASVREELVLGPDQPELIAALALMRALGWELRSLLGSDEDERDLEHLVALVSLMGNPARENQAVTLQATETRATAVVLDPDGEQVSRWRRALEAAGGSLVADEGFARLALERHAV